MFTVEKTAKTVEEALRLALIELDAKEEEVIVEILDEPKKALLGLIGGKEAKIKITLKEDCDRRAKQFLEDVFDKMNIIGKIQTRMNGKDLYVNVEGADMAVLIGRRGQTLDSLQYLVSLVVNKDRDDYIRVVLDTENYRDKRKETLEKLANRLAYKARKMRKDIILEPMNPYERRIIHSALQGNPHVSTRSEGEEPFRKVIIFLNK
jgi:spoIIIJ-associated protein